ncbi:MAG TPA: hypothetical protein VJZ00_23275 [Thermoanaerobaculia bacterium]|nr:hypothetical protein [Thermoanaerobaculia bacterium]
MTNLMRLLFSVGEHVAQLRTEVESFAEALTESERSHFYESLRTIELRNAELMLALPLRRITEH